MAYKKIEPLNIEDARLIFRNFSGKPDDFNSKGGTRKFGVIIDPSKYDIDALYADGWNIKMLKPKEEGGDPLYYLTVKLQYGEYRQPKVYTIVNGRYSMRDEYGNPIPLSEGAVGTIDDAELVNVKLVITPYCWEINGKEGVTAYLKTGYFEIQQDAFADDYE